jgi:hypothetical protein
MYSASRGILLASHNFTEGTFGSNPGLMESNRVGDHPVGILGWLQVSCVVLQSSSHLKASAHAESESVDLSTTLGLS